VPGGVTRERTAQRKVSGRNTGTRMRRLTDRNARRPVADRKRRVDRRSAVAHRGAACNGGWRCAYPPYTRQQRHIRQEQHIDQQRHIYQEQPIQHIHQARIHPDCTGQEGHTRQGRIP